MQSSVFDLTTLEIVVIVVTCLLVAWPFGRRRASDDGAGGDSPA